MLAVILPMSPDNLLKKEAAHDTKKMLWKPVFVLNRVVYIIEITKAMKIT